MNRALSITLLVVLSAASAFAQKSDKLTFNDNNGTPNSGTYSSNATFNLDVSIKFRGYTAAGLSFWLEAQNALAPHISITNVTYFTFLDPNQSGNPALFNSTIGADTGFMSESRDLGATGPPFVPSGTYLVASIEFTLSGAAPGNYQLRSTTLSPRGSEISDTSFATHFLGASSYRITISPADVLAPVPEPGTLTLLGLAAGGLGIRMARRRFSGSRHSVG